MYVRINVCMYIYLSDYTCIHIHTLFFIYLIVIYIYIYIYSYTHTNGIPTSVPLPARPEGKGAKALLVNQGQSGSRILLELP